MKLSIQTNRAPSGQRAFRVYEYGPLRLVTWTTDRSAGPWFGGEGHARQISRESAALLLIAIREMRRYAA